MYFSKIYSEISKKVGGAGNKGFCKCSDFIGTPGKFAYMGLVAVLIGVNFVSYRVCLSPLSGVHCA